MRPFRNVTHEAIITTLDMLLPTAADGLKPESAAYLCDDSEETRWRRNRNACRYVAI